MKFISGKRGLALLGCIALLYFAAGGAFAHQHTGGPENVCSICQVLHMPALAAAPVALVPEARQIARQVAPSEIASPLDSFATHRASRAPPSA